MYAQHKVCLVEGCKAPTHGKSYCRAHIKDKAKYMVISSDQRAHMRSNCCNARCTDGAPHEYGKQYCLRCKSPCIWHPSGLLRGV